jgi:hypothetical protein
MLLSNFLQDFNEVIKDGVLEAILNEVLFDTFFHGVLSNIVKQLFNKGSSLSVANHIEHIYGFVSVLDWYSNWMSCFFDISSESSRDPANMVAILELNHLLMSNTLCTYPRTEVSHRLLQPQVVPPFHGNQISKPHVSQLVNVYDEMPELVHPGHLILRPNERVGHTNHANVLHARDSELRHVHDIVLFPRKFSRKIVFIKLDRTIHE